MSTDSNTTNSYSFGTQLQINGTSISVYNNAYGIVRFGTTEFIKDNRTKIWKVLGYR